MMLFFRLIFLPVFLYSGVTFQLLLFLYMACIPIVLHFCCCFVFGFFDLRGAQPLAKCGIWLPLSFIFLAELCFYVSFHFHNETKTELMPIFYERWRIIFFGPKTFEGSARTQMSTLHTHPHPHVCLHRELSGGGWDDSCRMRKSGGKLQTPKWIGCVCVCIERGGKKGV